MNISDRQRQLIETYVDHLCGAYGGAEAVIAFLSQSPGEVARVSSPAMTTGGLNALTRYHILSAQVRLLEELSANGLLTGQASADGHLPCPMCGGSNLGDTLFLIDDEEVKGIHCCDCMTEAPIATWDGYQWRERSGARKAA